MTANDSLKAQLEAACNDLWWSSESDYPVETVWAAAPAESADRESSIQQVIDCAGEIGVVSVEDFFARAIAPKSWHTDEDKAHISQLQQLKTLLHSALSDLKAYRCGEVEVDVYVVGYTSDGDVAGVKTTVVET